MAQRTRADRRRPRPPAAPQGGAPAPAGKPGAGAPARARRAAPRRRLPLLRKPEPAPRAKASRSAGRYTPPTPRRVRHSPRWYPWVLLGLAVGGVAVIIANYSSALPGSPTNWYTLGSLIALLSAALLATRYH